MAEAQETKIRDYIKAGSKAQPPWPKPLAGLRPGIARGAAQRPARCAGQRRRDSRREPPAARDGPLRGGPDSVPQPTESEVSKTGKLLMGIAAIVIIGSSAAILLGFFLGGGRALYRMARGKPASSVYDEEFIQLDLARETGTKAQNQFTRPESEGLTGGVSLWKNGHKPEETPRKNRINPELKRRI